MKALSIKQPWATLIVEGVKDIENRTWKCPEKYIGQRVLTHASATPIDPSKLRNYLTEEMADASISYFRNRKFPNGAIIGSVEIVGCDINHPSIWAEKSKLFMGSEIPIIPTYNWILANPRIFPDPIPAKGRLGFWDYPNILAEPEEKNGELFCHCQLPVKERVQVMPFLDHFRCLFCGGRWYK